MPWKFLAVSSIGSIWKGTGVSPCEVLMVSACKPGRAVGLILRVTNRYVPLLLTAVADGWIAELFERTLAPVRFFPRTNRRTGLIVCRAHHDGGSTFSTSGFLSD